MPLDSSDLASHRDRVFDFALRFLRCREDAADVTQDVLVRFWQRCDGVAPDKQRAWVMRVTRNACLDYIRRKQTRQAYTPLSDSLEDFGDAQLSPHGLSESTDFRAHLERALDKLDEPYRSLVILREIHGFTYDELADALELPLSTAKVYLHRARKRLRTILRPVLSSEELIS